MSEKQFRVLICDGLVPEGLAIFENEPNFEVHNQVGISRQALLETIPSCDAVIIRSATQIDKEVLEAGKRLKVIARAGVGVDNVDITSSTRRGIVVMNAPSGNTTSAAEHTMALMLSLLRNVPQSDAKMRGGGWDRNGYIGKEAFGKTLGIIGLGRIGRTVAKRAQAFEMRTIGCDPFASAESAAADGIELVDQEVLFGSSDIITLHTPLTDDTEGLINRERLAKTKKGVFIVNTARGQLVVEDDLAEALKSGHVAGAALDVFQSEPPKSSPLIGLANVITTPHLGASTDEAQANVGIMVAEQVIDALLEREVRNAVNMPSLDSETQRVLGPYIDLADKLGQFVAQLVKGKISRIEVHCQGAITKENITPITTGATRGVISTLMPDAVNFVNAPILAEMQGLCVETSQRSEAAGFTNLVKVTLETGEQKLSASGTVFEGREDPRIVMVDDYVVEARPFGDLLVVRNEDKPGVVGLVGTVLAENGINISGMSLGPDRDQPWALEIINVDQPVPADVINTLNQSELILSARSVRIN